LITIRVAVRLISSSSALVAAQTAINAAPGQHRQNVSTPEMSVAWPQPARANSGKNSDASPARAAHT